MSCSREELLARAQRFAELYVFECNFNATDAYRRMREEIDPDNMPQHSSIRTSAHRFKNLPETKEAIARLKQENQTHYDIDKEEIISALKRIAFPEQDAKIPIKTQLDALEKLNKMGGLYTQNLNVDASAEIEVIID